MSERGTHAATAAFFVVIIALLAWATVDLAHSMGCRDACGARVVECHYDAGWAVCAPTNARPEVRVVDWSGLRRRNG